MEAEDHAEAGQGCGVAAVVLAAGAGITNMRLRIEEYPSYFLRGAIPGCRNVIFADVSALPRSLDG